MARSRNYCFTINNWDQADIEWFEEVDVKFIVIGKEEGELGTKHLQGYCNFKNEHTLKSLKKVHPTAHWEIRRGTDEQAYDYCIKDGDYLERGKRQMSQAAKGEAGKLSAEERRKMAESGDYSQLPPEHDKAYDYVHRKKLAESITDTVALDNHWLKGRSGVGKSRAIRDTFTSFYSKAINKWWDGYNYEKVVLIDDVDQSTTEWLPRLLKIWADHYAFNGEMKGAMLKMRPLIVLVTSQVGIGACCKTQEEIEALERRFKLWEWDPYQDDFWCQELGEAWKPYWQQRYQQAEADKKELDEAFDDAV